MFLGKFESAVDTSGRVVLPKGLRRGLRSDPESASLILAPGPGGAGLELHTPEGWCRQLEARRDLVASTGASHLDGLVDLLASACEVRLDRRGRLLLPAAWRALAGIRDAVVLVGIGDRVRLLSLERWNELVERRSGDPWPQSRGGVSPDHEPPLGGPDDPVP